MDRMTRIAVLFTLAALPVSGCARAPQPLPPTAAQPARVATEPLAFDPVKLSAEQNTLGSQTPTTAPTRVSAAEAAAIAARAWRASESSPTFVATREVVFSGYGVKDRVVWLVGAAPVAGRLHGGIAPVNGATATPASPKRGRAVYVVDASNGRILSSGFTSP